MLPQPNKFHCLSIAKLASPDAVTLKPELLRLEEDVVKLAVTFCAALMVTMQDVEVPVQAPDQPENIEPVAGVAVIVTVVPLG